MKRLRILTWHVHGSYLYYLSQVPHDFLVLSKPDRPAGYGGRIGHMAWGDNIIDTPVETVKDLQFDCILYQHRQHYLHDQYDILTEAQRRLPRIYLEHDTPQEHPTNTRHFVDDPDILLVHCTAFNELMWDNNRTPTTVIDHGVMVPAGVHYTGELERGIVVVNHLNRRGRRLGCDVFERARQQIPLDLVGMAAEELGGLGEVQLAQLPAFEARYRFFFHPIRYTSLGLALLEAMMIGMPVVGLATTELVTIIENGVSGLINTDLRVLENNMRELLRDPGLARKLGENGRRVVRDRFNIERFVNDWNRAFQLVAG